MNNRSIFQIAGFLTLTTITCAMMIGCEGGVAPFGAGNNNGGGNGNGGVSQQGSANLSGIVRFFDRTATSIFFEQEPNNSQGNPHFAGSVSGGERWEIWGETNADVDAVDRFRFTPTGPVTFSIEIGVKEGPEMGVALYDGKNFTCAGDDGEQYALCDETVDQDVITETLEFDGEFDLVLFGRSSVSKYIVHLTIDSAVSFTAADDRQRASTVTLAQRAVPRKRAKHFEGEFLAQFIPGADALREQEILDANGWRLMMEAPGGMCRVACADQSVPDAIDAFMKHPEAAMAQPNYIYRAAQATPNDELFSLQWHFDLIGLPEAWDITPGSANVTVAVIDSGVIAHPDLAPRLLFDRGIDMIIDTSISGDGDGIDNDPTDIGDRVNGQAVSSFHGSHVSGIIAAVSNNTVGVAGGALEGVNVVPIRALGVGGVGSSFDISEAIKYAAGLPNISGQTTTAVDVINMSFGATLSPFDTPPPCERAAIEAAANAGVVLVAAAGNDNSSNPSFPAAFDDVISVGSIGPDTSVRASYSNFGPTIDVVAPGGEAAFDITGDGFPDGVLSTLGDDSGASLDFAFGFLQGTSQASPHVAGVVALMLSMNPNLTPDGVRDILRSTARDLGTTGRDDNFGFGLVDAAAAVRAAQTAAIDQGDADPIDENEDPPRLAVTTQTLDFGGDINELTVSIFNAGLGTITVESVTAVEDIGEGWLTVTQGQPTASSNVGSITVSVDRGSQMQGALRGQIGIDAGAGGSTFINVIADVAPEQSTTSIPIFVILINTETQAQVGAVQADASDNLAWSFSNIDPGEYFIIAGSDTDGDGEVCGQRDLCGGVPALGNLSPITLGNEENRADIIITIADSLLRQ